MWFFFVHILYHIDAKISIAMIYEFRIMAKYSVNARFFRSVYPLFQLYTELCTMNKMLLSEL